MFNKYNNIQNNIIESYDSDSDDELYDMYTSETIEQSGGKIDESTFKIDGFYNKNIEGINNLGINFWELISIVLLITILLLIFLNNSKWENISYINKLYIIGILIFWGLLSCTNLIISILNKKYILEGTNFFKIEKYQMVLLIIITLCSLFGIIQYFNPEINLWISNPFMYGLIIAIIELTRIVFSYFIYIMPNVEIQKNNIFGEKSLPDMKFNGLYLLYSILFILSYLIIYFIPNGLKNYTINSYCYQEPIIYLIIIIIANIFSDKNGNIFIYLIITLGAIIYRINIGFQETLDDQLKDVEIPEQEVQYTTDYLQRMNRIKQMEQNGEIDFASIYKEEKKPEKSNIVNTKINTTPETPETPETPDFIETLESDNSNKQLTTEYKEIVNLQKNLDEKITEKMDNIRNEINSIQSTTTNTDTNVDTDTNTDTDTDTDTNTDTNKYNIKTI